MPCRFVFLILPLLVPSELDFLTLSTKRLKTVLSVESVVLEDEGSEVEVDVSLSNPCRFKQGRQYQFIGELEDRRNSLGGGGAADATPILVARIARDVTGLDMALYRAGLKAQERCLREIEERSSGGR